MPLRVTYKGRVVVHRRNTAEGLLLKLKSDKPGQPGEHVAVSEAEWKTHGREVFEPPSRPAAKS